MKRKRLRFAWSCSDFAHHEHRYKFIALICGKIQASLYQMGLGKRAIHLLVVALFLLGAGCSSSNLTKAFNTVNAVSAVRNGLPPVYELVVKSHPELTDEIVTFDAELQKAILSAYDAIIAMEQGTGTYNDYRLRITAIVEILNRYHVELLVPELKPAIDLIKQLLGVV